MTEQVRVSGFNVPGVPAGAEVTQHSRETTRPANPAEMTPGFVPPKQEPAPQTAASAAPATAPAADPTIMALLAALGGKQEQAAAPAATAPAPAAPASTDPVVSSLSNILTGSGIDVQRAIAKAVEHGDASLIDKAYIASVAGANAQHLTQLAETLVQHAEQAEQASAQACYALAGGQSNFHSAVAVWNQSAPAHLKPVIEVMMDSGNRTQIEAGAKMIVEFAKQNGGVVQPAGLVTGGAMPGAEAALSKEQFQAELAKLDKNARGYEQARGELFGRRAMGKKLGR